MKIGIRLCLGLALVLLSGTSQTVTPQKRLSDESLRLVKTDPEEAVRVCAEALKLGFTNPDAQVCAQRIKPQLPRVIRAARSATAAGQFAVAQAWCTSVLVLAPQDTDASACLATANERAAAHGKQILDIQIARRKLRAGDTKTAEAVVEKLAKTDFPDVVAEALALRREIDEGAEALQARESQALTALAEAENLITEGKRNEAIETLKPVVETAVNPQLRLRAGRLLNATRIGPATAWWDAVKSPTVYQYLGALSVVAALWFIPHFLRGVWRWTFGKVIARLIPIRWTFAGVRDDHKLGAAEPTLDAIHRIPNEVRKPIWRTTRVLFHSQVDGTVELLEDCFLPRNAKAPYMREPVFATPAWTGRAADNVLAEAFQNLTFNIGGIGFNAVAKFWKALMDWWHAGEPTFSGVAEEVTPADGSAKQLMIRLTTAGGPYGTVSVVASSPREGDDPSCIALTAERAAYKLLYRIAQNEDTAEQVDAHAAFRQAANLLGCLVRSTADTTSDAEKMRDQHTVAVLNSLEFVRQVFARDESHIVYYHESLRLLAVGFVLVRKYEAALTRLRELEDSVAGRQDQRSKDLEVESLYNQAMLHFCGALSREVETGRELGIAEFLLSQVQKHRTDPLAKAAAARKVVLLTRKSVSDWLALGSDAVETLLCAARDTLKELEDSHKDAVAAHRRASYLIASELRRSIAMARVRGIVAFHVSDRTWWGLDEGKKKPIRDQIQSSLADLEAADILKATTDSQALRGYALLLTGRYEDAGRYAQSASKLDEKNPWACYVEAESFFQRGDREAAAKRIQEFKGNDSTLPTLLVLKALLAKSEAAAA
jgi:tetratricopeptide (TPR) repeat protein